MNHVEFKKKLNIENDLPHWNEIPEDYLDLLLEIDGHTKVLEKLSESFFNINKDNTSEDPRVWEVVSLFYRDTNRIHQAIEILDNLYVGMLNYQLAKDKRIHKGMPLVWLSDFHSSLNHPAVSLRYLMLTLCEDSIRDINALGKLNKSEGGVYFRLAYQWGMSDAHIDEYAFIFHKIAKENNKYSLFPEWMLQQTDNIWNTTVCSSGEAYIYKAYPPYLNFLKSNFGSGTGKEMELTAEYLLQCIPGARTYRRKISHSTDYDVVCALEGVFADFRRELGRYIVCECKDWNSNVGFSTIAKFCRVLDSIKCKSGIIFAKKGISGEAHTKDATREILKVFQDRSIAIIVINEDDIDDIINGKNFITMLRSKYESIILDLESKL